MMSATNFSRFHLRRVGPPATRTESSNLMCFTRPVTFIGRNPSQVDYVISSSNFVQNAIISRRHARVVRSVDLSSFRLHDDSRNGVFVNSVKISGSVILHEGDCVTFGHPMGEKLQPGSRVRQPDSEYQFVFERCECAIPLNQFSHATTSPQLSSQFNEETIAVSPMILGSVEKLGPVTVEGSFRAPAPLVGKSLSLKHISRKSGTSAKVESRPCVVDSAVSYPSAELISAYIPNNSDAFQSVNSSVLLESEKHSSETAVSCSSGNASEIVLSVSDVPALQESSVFDSTSSCDPLGPVFNVSASDPVQSDGNAVCSSSAGKVRKVSSSDTDEAVVSSNESLSSTVITSSNTNLSSSEMDLFSICSQSGSVVKPELQSVEAFSEHLPEMNLIEKQSKESESDACKSEMVQAVACSVNISTGLGSTIQFQQGEEAKVEFKENETTDCGDTSEIKGEDDKIMFGVSQVIPSTDQYSMIEDYSAEAGDRVAVKKTRECGDMFVCDPVVRDVQVSYAAEIERNSFGDKQLIPVESKETISEKEETMDHKLKSSEDFKEIREEEETDKVSTAVCCDEMLECERNDSIVTEDLRVVEMVVQTDSNLMQTVEEAKCENVRAKAELHFANDVLECTSIYDRSYSELTAFNPDLTITEQVQKGPEQKAMEVEVQCFKIPLQVAESAAEVADLELVASYELANKEVATRDAGIDRSTGMALETVHPTANTAGDDTVTGVPVVVRYFGPETVVTSGNAYSEITTEGTVLGSITERNTEIPWKEIVSKATTGSDRNEDVLQATTEVSNAEECPTSVTILTVHTASSIENDLLALNAEGNSMDADSCPIIDFESDSKETAAEGIIAQEFSDDITIMMLVAAEVMDRKTMADFTAVAETSDTGLSGEVIAAFESKDIATEETCLHFADGEHFLEAGVKEESEAVRSSAEKVVVQRMFTEANVTEMTGVGETDTSNAEEAFTQDDVIHEEIRVFETVNAFRMDSVGEIIGCNTPGEDAVALPGDAVSEEMVTVKDAAKEKELLTEETITDADSLVTTIDDRVRGFNTETTTILVEATVDAKTITSEKTRTGVLTETDVTADSSFFVVVDEAKDEDVIKDEDGEKDKLGAQEEFDAKDKDGAKDEDGAKDKNWAQDVDETKDENLMMDSHDSIDFVPVEYENSQGSNSILSATKTTEINLPACDIESGSNSVTNVMEMSGLVGEDKVNSSEPWQRMLFVPLHTSTPLEDGEESDEEKTDSDFHAERINLETFFCGAADIRSAFERTKSNSHLSEDSLKASKGICSWTEFIHPDSSTLMTGDQTKDSDPSDTSEVLDYAYEVRELGQRDDQHSLPGSELQKNEDIAASDKQDDAVATFKVGEQYEGNAMEDLVEPEEDISEDASGYKVQVDANMENVETGQAPPDSTGESVKTPGDQPGNASESQHQVPGNGNEALQMVGNGEFVPEDEVGQLETEDVAEPEGIGEMEVAPTTRDVVELEEDAEVNVARQLLGVAQLEAATHPEDDAELEIATQPEDAHEKGVETEEWVDEDATHDMVEMSEKMSENAASVADEVIVESATLRLVIPDGHFLECAAVEEVCKVTTNNKVLIDATGNETKKQVDDFAAAGDLMKIDEQVPEGARKESETDEDVQEDATQEVFGAKNQLAEVGIEMVSETEGRALSDDSGKIMRVIECVLEDVITAVVKTAENPKNDENCEISVEDGYCIETETEKQVSEVVCKVVENDNAVSAITTGESEECVPDEIIRNGMEAEVQQPLETGQKTIKCFFDAVELFSLEQSESVMETVFHVSEEATDMMLAEMSKDVVQTEEETVENCEGVLADVVRPEFGLLEKGTVQNRGKLLEPVIQTGSELPGERTLVNSLEFSKDVVESEARLREEGSEELVENKLHLSGEYTVKFSLEQPGIIVEVEVSLPEQVHKLKTSEESTVEVLQAVANSLEVVQSDATPNDEDIVKVVLHEHPCKDVNDVGTTHMFIRSAEKVTEVQILEGATEMFSKAVTSGELLGVGRETFVPSETTREQVAIESRNMDDDKANPMETVSDIVSAEVGLHAVSREVVTETLTDPLPSLSPKDGSSQMTCFGGILVHEEGDVIPPSKSEMSDRKHILSVAEQVIIKKEVQCQGASIENKYQRTLLPKTEKFEDDSDSLSHTAVEEGQFDDVDSDEADASIRFSTENTSSSSLWPQVVSNSPACPPSILGGLRWVPSPSLSYSSPLCRPGVISPLVQHTPILSDARKRKRPLEPDFGWKRSRLEQSAGLGELPPSLLHPDLSQENVEGCGSTSKTDLSPAFETLQHASKPEIESDELSGRNCDSSQLDSCRNERRSQPNDDTSVRETVDKGSVEADLKNENSSGVDSRVNRDFSLPKKTKPVTSPGLVENVHGMQEVAVRDEVNDVILLELMKLENETQSNDLGDMVKDDIIGENMEEILEKGMMDGEVSCVQQQLSCSGDAMDELKISVESNRVEEMESSVNLEKELFVESVVKSISAGMTDAEMSENCFEGQVAVTMMEELTAEVGELHKSMEKEIYAQQNAEGQKSEELNPNVISDGPWVDKEVSFKTIHDVIPLHLGMERHLPEVLPQEINGHVSESDVVAESISEAVEEISGESEQPFIKNDDDKSGGGQVAVECLNSKTSDATDRCNIDDAQSEEGDFAGECFAAVHVDRSDEPSALVSDVSLNCRFDSSASYAVVLDREGPFTSTQLPPDEEVSCDKEWLPPSSPQFAISGTQDDIFAEDSEHTMNVSRNSPVPFSGLDLHRASVDSDLQKASDAVISLSLPLTGRSVGSDGVDVDTDGESLHLFLEMSQGVCTQPTTSQVDHGALVKMERVIGSKEMEALLDSDDPGDVTVIPEDEEGHRMDVLDNLHMDKGSSRSSSGDDCADDLAPGEGCFTIDDQLGDGCTVDIEPQNDEGIATASKDECCHIDVVQFNEAHLEKGSEENNNGDIGSKIQSEANMVGDGMLTDGHYEENAGSNETVLLLNCDDVAHMSSPADNQTSDNAVLAIGDCSVDKRNFQTEGMGNSQDMIATEAISQLTPSQAMDKHSTFLLSASSSRNNAMNNVDNVYDNDALSSVSGTEFVAERETIDLITDDETQNIAGENNGLGVCKEVVYDDHVDRYGLDVGNAERYVEHIDDKEIRQVEGWQSEDDESKSLRTIGLTCVAVNAIDLDRFNIICNDDKIVEPNSSAANIAEEASIACSNFESSESGQAIVTLKVQHQSQPEQSLQILENSVRHINYSFDEVEQCPVDVDVDNDQQRANAGQEESHDKDKVGLCAPLQHEESFGELDSGTMNDVTVQGETLPIVDHGTKSVDASLFVRSESPDFDIALPKGFGGSSSNESTNKGEQEEDEDEEDKDKGDDEDNEESSRSSSPDIFICDPEQQRYTDLKTGAEVMDAPAFDDSIDDFTPPTVDLSCIDSDHDEPTLVKLPTAKLDSAHLRASSLKVFSDSSRVQLESALKARSSEVLSKKRNLSDPDDRLADSKRLKIQSSPVNLDTEMATFSDFQLPEPPRSPFTVSSTASDDISCSNENFTNLYSQSLFSQDQETSVSQVVRSESRRRSQVVSGVLQKIKSKLETNTKQIEISGMESRSSSPEPLEPGRETFVPPASSDANEINSSVEKSIFQSYSAIVNELKTIFQNNLPGIKSQRLLSWRNEISTMESVHCLPKTIVAVVGETGAGKSSLLNALLDHADVLPTSGMRACTAVVVQVADNPHSDSYEAEIEFLSEEEWMEELRILLRELTGRNGKVRTQQPDQNSDSIVAWSKIRAVYGKFSNCVTLEQLSLQKTVTKWLGKTKRIVHTSPREFKKEIDRYIESRDVGSGGDYWPIVKLVRTRIPNCGICSSGAILVDMPGMGDSNAARNNIAKQYMQNCNSVWVVSNIHRAVDNKIAKDLLGEHFRRQLLMDGQYSSVSFICTKTDIVNTSETISELHMEGECDVLLNAISELEEKILRREKESRKFTQKMTVLSEKIEALKREKISLSTDVEELSQVLVDEEEIDDEVSETLTQLQQTVASKDEILQSANTDLECLRSAEANNQREVTDCNRLIRQKRKQLRELCAKARNEYSTRQIRRDFRAGIKEVQKKTRRKTGGGSASADEMDSNGSDDEDDDDDDDSDGICRTVENLKVFCVSSTEYLKLTGKLKKDGPAEVFQSIDDTGIPAVVNYTHTLTRVRRRQGVERLGKSLGRFVYEVLSYVSDAGTKDHTTREAAKLIFEELTAELRKDFTQKTSEIVQQIGDLFDQQLLPKIDLGVQSAVDSAQGTVVNWGVKSNKENRAAGGLPWSTYKATASRSGIFKSPTYGPIDFNEDLAGPMYDALTVTWNKIFNCQMSTILDKLKESILSVLTKFCQDLHVELGQVPVDSVHLARIKQQVILSSENRLSEAIVQLKEFITQRQRDVNRVIMPSIQTDMQPAYSYCSAEVGQGQFLRMKKVMVDHVDSTKQTMMEQAASKIIEQLWELQTEIELRLNDVFESLIQDLSGLYEPIWESRNPLLLQRPAFINDILGLKAQMFSFFEKIDFSCDAPELLIFDKTSAFMTAKKEKPPAMKDVSARSHGYGSGLQSPEQSYVSLHKEAAAVKIKIELLSSQKSLNVKPWTSSNLPPVKVEDRGSCSKGLVTASMSHAGDFIDLTKDDDDDDSTEHVSLLAKRRRK